MCSLSSEMDCDGRIADDDEVLPVDCGELMLFLARMPAHVCINDLTISPTWNRMYVPQAQGIPN